MGAFMIVMAIWLIILGVIFIVFALNSMDDPFFGIVAGGVCIIFAIISFTNASTIGYMTDHYKVDVKLIPIEEPK